MIPQFLSALMSLITTFSQGGKPAVTPPFPKDQVIQRGQQVSALARELKNLIHQNQGSGEETGGNENGDPTVTPTPHPKPDTTRVPAVNLRSGKDMPTFIPMVALQRSQALEAPTPTPVPTNNDEGNTGDQTSQPEEGQNSAGNRAFNQGRGNSAQNNGR